MGTAIGQSLPLAIGIALSPIPIIAVVLMLTSRSARVNPTWVSWVKIILGALGANPKNLILAVSGAATIAQTGISGGEQAVAYLVFALIGAKLIGDAIGALSA